jgi:hypothetical protein
MQKKYTTSEQFIIKFYHFFKFQTKTQRDLVADKELAKTTVEQLSTTWRRD